MTDYVEKSGKLAPLNGKVGDLRVRIRKDHVVTQDELTFLRTEIQHTTEFSIAEDIMSCFQWLHDPANIPFIEPYLYKGNADAAKMAVWTLCWLGYGHEIKDYMISGVEPGLPWDTNDTLAAGILPAVGHHLHTHRDRDLAQLLIRWRPRPPGDPVVFSKPFGRGYDEVRRLWSMTETAMGYAVGADPLALTDDQALMDASVARFVAERQDG